MFLSPLLGAVFKDVLAPHLGEFKQHKSDDIRCGDLELEPESAVDVVAAFLFLVEHPAAAADHDVLAQFSEVGGYIRFGLDEVCRLVVSNVDWCYHCSVVNIQHLTQ